MSGRVPLCRVCKEREVEVIDGWESTQCSRCNDKDIQRNREREEWNHFHCD